MGSWLLVLSGAVAGALVTVACTAWWSGRRHGPTATTAARHPDGSRPSTRPSTGPSTGPSVSPVAGAVLAALPGSAVLVGPGDVVVEVSQDTYALGLVRNGRLVEPRLRELVAQVRRDGRIREDELVVRHGRQRSPEHLAARVAPLDERLLLVLVEDRTRERRVEAVRRDFVANVSHELKTPVGAMSLLAEAVAQAADEPAAVRRFAGRMQVEGERLSRLVQQVIELSRLQDDELLVEPVCVDVDALTAYALDRSRTDADARGIRLASQSGTGLTARGSVEQLQVALGNLVENAVTYSDAGSRVSVTAKAAGAEVAITVTDRGIGIPEAELGRIFERFYRVDPARATSTGGTGLGLSIVKHVAASHGGEVRVWSVEGTGSSFTLALPCWERPLTPSDDPATSVPEEAVS